MTALLWALRNWKLILAGIGFAFLGLKLLSAQAEARHWEKQAVNFEGLYRSEKLATAATIANARSAAAKAQADDLAHARAVEQHQASITQEVSSDYQARLAALRARYDALRLRNGAASADTSGASVAGMSEAPDSASGLDAAPEVDPFACEANTLQLDSLQAWVRQTLTPDPSP